MSSPGLAHRIAAPRSAEDAEERYVAARDAWLAAMRAASSGRPADMASLAIAQEAYEAAAAERERWQSAARAAPPVDLEPESRLPIEVIVDQALAWRRVHEQEKRRGLLGRLFGRRKDRDG